MDGEKISLPITLKEGNGGPVFFIGERAPVMFIKIPSDIFWQSLLCLMQLHMKIVATIDKSIKLF